MQGRKRGGRKKLGTMGVGKERNLEMIGSEDTREGSEGRQLARGKDGE